MHSRTEHADTLTGETHVNLHARTQPQSGHRRYGEQLRNDSEKVLGCLCFISIRKCVKEGVLS